MSALAVEPMTYHGPGWTITLPVSGRPGETVDYQLWAPGGGRDFWQAAWTGDAGMTGDLTRGDSMEAVLGILPDPIAAAFREVAA
jgi:hypothetical protein